jgi:hypothetical protein
MRGRVYRSGGVPAKRVCRGSPAFARIRSNRAQVSGNDPLTFALAESARERPAMTIREAQTYIQRHWPNLQAAGLGLAIGLTLFLGVRAISAHPGQGCSQLGQIREQWEIGMRSQPLMCVATLDGDLVYDRMILPPPKRHHQQQ